jgi:aminopeptidase
MSAPTPKEADRLARRVLTTRLKLKAGENVTIETYPSALPWALGIVREARRIGARPLLHYEDEYSYWAAVNEGKWDLIGQPGKHEWSALENTDVYLYFWGPEDRARLARLPETTAERLVAFNPKWYHVADRHRVRGLRMGIALVTPSSARHWGVPFEAWRDEVVRSTMVDPADLVASSEKVRRAFLRGSEVRIRHPNGTDLTVELAGRKPMMSLGWTTPATRRQPFGVMANAPDGSVYVAIDESTADGVLVSNRLSTRIGEPVRGGKWTFRRGKLVRQRYAEGSAAMRGAWRTAGKNRGRPAMLEVGLDPTVERAPGLDENERGAVSVGIGGNVGFGGTTRSPLWMHLAVAGAELSIDGKTLAQGGRIV